MTSDGTDPGVTSNRHCRASVSRLPPLPAGSSVFQAVKKEYVLDQTVSSSCHLPDLCKKSVCRRSLQTGPSLWQGPMVFYKGTPLHLGTVLYLRRKLCQMTSGGRHGTSRLYETRADVSGRVLARKKCQRQGGEVEEVGVGVGKGDARCFWLRRSGV